MPPTSFLGELFASIKARRHRRQERINEEGAQISRRLQELLGPPQPRQVEPPSTKGPRSEMIQAVLIAARLEH
jgi:hypothetical protein